jgi:hypothetical protein
MHLNKDRRENLKGRHASNEVEAINLGFATDCNTIDSVVTKFLIEGTGKIVISNQVRFDEDFYPYRNRNMIERHLNDIAKLCILIIDRGD